MSRSYRKFPISRMVLWGKSLKKGKQIANRKIRRKLRNPNVKISNGRYYKYLGLDSWDLWEFKFYETRQDRISKWEQEQAEISNGVHKYRCTWTLEEAINEWEKYYIRK